MTNQSIQLKLNVSEETKSMLRTLADQKDQTMSATIDAMVRQAYSALSATPPAKVVPAYIGTREQRRAYRQARYAKLSPANVRKYKEAHPNPTPEEYATLSMMELKASKESK